jgi:hypothetical protein
MAERTIEDRLHEEYNALLLAIRRTLAQLEAEISYHVLPISRGLAAFGQIVVTSRIKGV